ncbi:fimbria/pilus periplasmic chaperone [Escherichia coli]|nr:fimbria/pilus periplasmic chaperone [Escherichia coli]EFV1940734.1 fimbria/pilus periplasmic chaperone [Escherichia coli]
MATVLLLLLFACHSTVANAAVALGATRVIYPANQKQVLLPVTNNDPASVYLIQSWIENAGDQKDTQFVITPPLFSMQGKKENTLRIINATNHQRGQEQISISQQLGNYGTTFFSASRQSYWNTSRSDQQISFGLNVPFGDITTSLRFLLATFCALFTATLQAADVTITVNGRVVAKPCTIQTKEANVNLGDLYTRNLQQPGSTSGWHNITLSLTDCPVETSAVTAIVTGSTDNTGYYKNEGTAENIQIELRDDQDATLKNGDSKTVIVDEITRNAQFPLKARAITVNGNASQGTIEALINVIYTWQ